MTIRKSLFLAFALCCMAFAQEMPKIAVYATGGQSSSENKALSNKMTHALVSSGKYKTIERSDAFLEQIAAEQEKQRSGSIDDNQISRIGKMSGADYVCIAEIVEAFGGHQVSARIVSVETIEVVASGDAAGVLNSMQALDDLSNEVIASMLGYVRPDVVAAEESEEAVAPAAAPTVSRDYMAEKRARLEAELPAVTQREEEDVATDYLDYSPPRKKLHEGKFPAAYYISSFMPNIKSFYAREGKEAARKGLNIMVGSENYGKSLFGASLFGGYGMLGRDVHEIILGIDLKKMLWFWDDVIGIPLSVGFAWRGQWMEIENKLVAEFIKEPLFSSESENYLNKKRSMNRNNFDIMPAVDLQIAFAKIFSIYAGYMYRLNYPGDWTIKYKIKGKSYGKNESGKEFTVPEEYNPLRNSKEQVFGVPGTLRFGLKAH